MGRHPSNGAPSFRFHPAEVAQMDSILQKYEGHVPPREFLMALAQSFSDSPERAGKSVVQMKQVWNWFQNRRFALRAKVVKSPGKPITSSVFRDEVTPVRYIPPVPQQTALSSGSHVVRNTTEPPPMEFEAKSARDGAWYDVQEFLSHRYLETGNPEVLVRFSGFGLGEDEWVNIRKHVRQRSLPCEASECIAVLNGDLILCFQEGKEQALYFDAHVLDAQRRRHDVRGCRCRFLVRFDHDQSEEIVPLRKMCRRPETDHRLQQLHAANEAAASSSVSVRPSIETSTSSPSSLPTPSSIGPPTPPPIGVPASFPIGAPTPSPIRPPTPVPTSVSPAPLTVCTQTSAPVPVLMKAENNNPAQILVHASKKVDSDNQAQIPSPQAESSKTDTDNPGLVLGSNKVETAPVAVIVPEPIKIKIETDNSALLPETNKVVTAPVQVLVPEPNKIGTGMPTSLPERNRIETESQDPASIPKPVRVLNESPDPLSSLIKVNSISPGPSASQTFAQANFTGPVHVNKHLQARKFRGMVDSISVRPSAAQTGARSNFTGPIDVNKLLESKKAEIVVLTGRK